MNTSQQLLLLLSFWFLIIRASSQVPSCHRNDRTALIAVKSELGNPETLSNWGAQRSCCGSSLEGVECNAKSRIISIKVIDIPKPVPFPPSVTKLRHLRALTFSNANLSGPIPTFICGMKTLQSIDVSNNGLTGSIPDCFGSWVTKIDLGHNRLTGGIPRQMVGLIKLVYFDVGYNKLCGKIPTGGAMTKFNRSSFDHNNNCLCGSVCGKCC